MHEYVSLGTSTTVAVYSPRFHHRRSNPIHSRLQALRRQTPIMPLQPLLPRQKPQCLRRRDTNLNPSY